MVDETDQLFQAKAEDNERFYEFAYKFLSEVASLGNSACGRLIIVLSESSRLSTDMTGTKLDLNHSELVDFRILSRQLNTNTNRFKSLTIALPRPDSIDNALAILHPSEALVRQRRFSEEERWKARKRMFVDGCNVRSLEKSVLSASADILPSNHVCRKLWIQLLFLWFGQTDN